VVDFDMPFFSMMNFMLKWAIASLPAAIILFVIGIAIMAVLGAASPACSCGPRNDRIAVLVKSLRPGNKMSSDECPIELAAHPWGLPCSMQGYLSGYGAELSR
jgi:hypothetical protein